MINRGGEGSPRWQMVEEKGIMKKTPVSIACVPLRTFCCPATRRFRQWR